MTNRITKYCSTLGVQKQLGGKKTLTVTFIYLPRNLSHMYYWQDLRISSFVR